MNDVFKPSKHIVFLVKRVQPSFRCSSSLFWMWAQEKWFQSSFSGTLVSTIILFSVDYIFETSGLILVNNNDWKSSKKLWGRILGNKWMEIISPCLVCHVVRRAYDIRNYIITIMTTRTGMENRGHQRRNMEKYLSLTFTLESLKSQSTPYKLYASCFLRDRF